MHANTTDWTLGARVRFRRPLMRTTTYTGAFSGLIRGKAWVPSTDETLRNGIIVGRRTLRNGRLRQEDHGTEMEVTDTLTAYLVAYNIHRSPVLVRPGDIRMAWHEVEAPEGGGWPLEVTE